MRKTAFLLCILLGFLTSVGQLSNAQLDEFEKIKGTDHKAGFLEKYFPILRDSAEEKIIALGTVLKQLQERKNNCDGAVVNYEIGYHLLVGMEDYTNSMRYEIAALQNFEQCRDSVGIMRSNFLIGSALQYSRNHMQALPYFKRAIPIARRLVPVIDYANLLNAVADCFVQLNKPDSALPYIREAIAVTNPVNDQQSSAIFLATLGEVKMLQKQYDSAKSILKGSLDNAVRYNFTDVLGGVCNDLAQVYYEQHAFDSAIVYARRTTTYPVYRSFLIDAYEWLYKSFEKKNNADSAARYYKLSVDLRDSTFSREKNTAAQSIGFQQQLWEKEKQHEIIQAKKDFSNRLTLWIVGSTLLIILITTLLIYRNYQRQKHARAKVEAAYAKLKSTQAQLIQSEKMASLGQLTAGIAHEIQNPLNFVNNFSEINNELIDELRREMENGKNETVEELLNDVYANNEKIVLHGKRADAIVKGMLEHSRQGTGQKQQTDINVLADEYLKLACHGMRAKDNRFNVTMKTDFDNSLGKINIVPQDIGRVLLNLYNNAFYAMQEKQKNTEMGYNPVITVSTRKLNERVEIKVTDNGVGISPEIVGKIFQPFFTTKPTGQATGLGLSLAYDIVKAHGGELKVDTGKEEGSVFIVEI